MRPLLPEPDASCGSNDLGLHKLQPTQATKAQLQLRVYALEQQVLAMQRSTSWRVSAPVRWASRAVQRLRGTYPDAAGTFTMAADDYSEWLRLYGSWDDAQHRAALTEVEGWPSQPLISVLMPTYNAHLPWLDEAIASVRAQAYPNWELCIADDASTDPAIAARLAQVSATDQRIKHVLRPRNGHIAEASNSALAIASGDWIVLLDHDDLLTPDALYRVAKEITADPQLRLIYSDEDKIDAVGQRFAPYFKPDWNIDLFHSQNFYCHLSAYETALARSVSGFRKGFEGAQDYDLTLRCVERVAVKQIRHIPRVLYHWRAHANSTAQEMTTKPYAEVAAERALDEHFERTGVIARSERAPYGYRTHYALPSEPPLVSLIIPTRDALGLVRECIESIVRETRYPNYEIVLIDNGSTEKDALDYFEALRAQRGFSVVRDDGPFNYSALNNAAVKTARGELIGLINNDVTAISPEWLSEMVSIALQPGVGAVGAKLLYPDDTVQHGGVVLGIGQVAGHAHKHISRYEGGYFGRAFVTQSFSAVTAACLVVRKSAYLEVGGLDEEHLTVSYNDVDFCLRLREAGYRNVWTPYAELYHHESATRQHDMSPPQRERDERERTYMKQRWGALLQNDPAYSPNLTLHAEDFGLAWPPRTASHAATADPLKAVPA